VTMW